jgi:hypothetical protein
MSKSERRLVEKYASDREHCIQALFRFTTRIVERGGDTPEPPRDAACGEAPREEPADREGAQGTAEECSAVDQEAIGEDQPSP